MRCLFLLSFTILQFCLYAQKSETFYDWKWKPSAVSTARFLSVVEPADSLWQRTDYYIRERRLQMKGYFTDKECSTRHGYFMYYHSNGQLSSKGLYRNNRHQGLWLKYHTNGSLSDSSNYENGKWVGTQLSWYANGVVSDSIIYHPGGRSERIHWFDNGKLSSSGFEDNRQQVGNWKYYHRNGLISAEEEYNAGKLVSRVYYDEGGTAIKDTANRDRLAMCEKNWGQYLSSNLVMPLDMNLVNGDEAVVVVDFVIDEEGNVADASVYSSFHSKVDKMVLKVIKKSPRWIPAIDHNRKVKAYRRQSVTIQQEERF
jgi:TonB family protein